MNVHTVPTVLYCAITCQFLGQLAASISRCRTLVGSPVHQPFLRDSPRLAVAPCPRPASLQRRGWGAAAL